MIKGPFYAAKQRRSSGAIFIAENPLFLPIRLRAAAAAAIPKRADGHFRLAVFLSDSHRLYEQ